MRSKFEPSLPASVRLGDLELLVTLASCASFTETAARRGVARSTVSRRVAELEALVGAELFDRSTRTITTTAAGARFLRHARPAIEGLQTALSAVDPGQGLRGTLRVAAPPVLSGLVMVPAVLGLLADHPHVDIQHESRSAFSDLELERIDVALRLGEDARGHQGRVLGHARLVLVAREPGPASPQDLRPSELLGPQAPLTLQREGVEHRVVPQGRLRTADYGAQLAAARAGLGIARAPLPMVAGALSSGELVRVLPDWSAGRLALRCLHRSRRPLVQELVARIEASPVLPGLLA